MRETYVSSATADQVAQVGLGQLVLGQISDVHAVLRVDRGHKLREFLGRLGLDTHADLRDIVVLGAHAVSELGHIARDCKGKDGVSSVCSY